MRATVMYGAGDVRIETVPDAGLVEPTDALVRVTRAGVCGRLHGANHCAGGRYPELLERMTE